MIVVMKQTSSEADVDRVLQFLEKHGLSGHPSQGVERTVIGVLGAVGPSGIPGSISGINPALANLSKACLAWIELFGSPSPISLLAASSIQRIALLMCLFDALKMGW